MVRMLGWLLSLPLQIVIWLLRQFFMLLLSLLVRLAFWLGLLALLLWWIGLPLPVLGEHGWSGQWLRGLLFEMLLVLFNWIIE
jgi:hypothetical protein